MIRTAARTRAHVAVVGFALGAVACGSDTTGPAHVQGAYVLSSATGQYAPASGTLFLDTDGRYFHTRTYPADGGIPSQTTRQNGTYKLSPDQIEFDFEVPCGDTPCIARLFGRRTTNGLVFEYPGPADGPITETYTSVAF